MKKKLKSRGKTLFLKKSQYNTDKKDKIRATSKVTSRKNSKSKINILKSVNNFSTISKKSEYGMDNQRLGKSKNKFITRKKRSTMIPSKKRSKSAVGKSNTKKVKESESNISKSKVSNLRRKFTIKGVKSKVSAKRNKTLPKNKIKRK